MYLCFYDRRSVDIYEVYELICIVVLCAFGSSQAVLTHEAVFGVKSSFFLFLLLGGWFIHFFSFCEFCPGVRWIASARTNGLFARKCAFFGRFNTNLGMPAIVSNLSAIHQLMFIKHLCGLFLLPISSHSSWIACCAVILITSSNFVCGTGPWYTWNVNCYLNLCAWFSTYFGYI